MVYVFTLKIIKRDCSVRKDFWQMKTSGTELISLVLFGESNPFFLWYGGGIKENYVFCIIVCSIYFFKF